MAVGMGLHVDMTAHICSFVIYTDNVQLLYVVLPVNLGCHGVAAQVQ